MSSMLYGKSLGFILVLEVSGLSFSYAGFGSSWASPSLAAGTALQVSSSCALDSISKDEFLERHAFSLDNFMENVPGFILGRLGPIGAEARLSRYGMGRGRCLVYLDGVLLNDPHEGGIHLELVPTTAVGGIVLGDSPPGLFPGRGGIEGALLILDPPPPEGGAATSIELSKGTLNLRQRRVRFSSMRSTLGLDLAYDELLNDGYQYDARGIVGGEGFGSSAAKTYSVRLRGEMANGFGYAFSFRKFESSLKGDMLGLERERRRNGDLAVIAASLPRLRLRFYHREHRFSLPDSHTVNQTIGAYADGRFLKRGRARLDLGGGAEDIVARETVGGYVAAPRVRRMFLDSEASYQLWDGAFVALDGSIQKEKGMSGWGMGVALLDRLSRRHEAKLELRRSFRVPSLGERFLPRHKVLLNDQIEVEGNPELKSEAAYSSLLRVRSRYENLHNTLELKLERVSNPIVDLRGSDGGATIVYPGNGKGEALYVVEDRAKFRTQLRGFRMRLGGGFFYAGGDRENFFSLVPRLRLDVFFSVGRDLFKSSSALLLMAEYQHTSPRGESDNGGLPAYGLLHLKLDVRLVDAHLYLLLMNVFDERYETVGTYLMTPRTLVYGVEWKLFD